MTPADVEFFWFNTDRKYRIRPMEAPQSEKSISVKQYVVVHRDVGVVGTFSSDDAKVAWLSDEQCEEIVRRIREDRVWGSK